MTDIRRVFTVDGKPFFPIGGQSHNSSGYGEAEWSTAFHALSLIQGNTLEIPVYWEQVEPQEGIHDFSNLDLLLSAARLQNVHLVLLWFGTWKNGNMDYAPDWVKTDPERFVRVTSPSGHDIWVLSSHCRTTFEADKRAFVALCQHLETVDSAEGTVIAIQIENEPGILGSDRDYGAAAQAEFVSQVPDALVSRLAAGAGGWVHTQWQASGALRTGSWPELFGDAAGELMTAWSIAGYVDKLAEAGKAVHRLPMIVNVWLGENGWRIPGESYPSGGAVTKVLDLYKWATPHIDLIAPDIYLGDAKNYTDVCRAYARADNPLFVPESARSGTNPMRLFQAIGSYDAIGYAFFGIEEIVGGGGDVRPESQSLVDSFRCVTAATPLLLKYQGTGCIHVVAQEADLPQQLLDLDGYLGLIEYEGGYPRDWRHLRSDGQPAQAPGAPGRGLIIQTSRHEFYVIGANYRLHLRPESAPADHLRSDQLHGRLLTHLNHYVRVDEGHFDAEGSFCVDRRRNGDETDNGIWVEPDAGVIHVVLCE